MLNKVQVHCQEGISISSNGVPPMGPSVNPQRSQGSSRSSSKFKELALALLAQLSAQPDFKLVYKLDFVHTIS